MKERIEALVIGDELLDGRVIDTNTVRLAQALSQVGLHLLQRTTITDDIDIIVREARAISARGTTLCVVSGGLGPTTDDVTAAAFAKYAGVTLLRDETQVTAIRERLQRRGRTMTDNQLRQADRPSGAKLIINPVGTAPGFDITVEGCRFVSVPGVPAEFDALVDAAVIAPLRAQNAPVARRALYTFGLIEAEVDRRVDALHSQWPTVRVQFRVKFPEIHVTLHAPDTEQAALDEAFAYAQAQLGEYVYATDDSSFAGTLVQRMRQAGATLAIAESCTGGLITDMITDIPGSSAVFLYGSVVYHNDVKTSMLQVPHAILQEHGAVSEAVVVQMAEHVRAACGATYALGVSGIAGPDGGTADKPVGTVWMACASVAGTTAQRLQLPLDRRGNKSLAAYNALNMVRRLLS